MLSCVLIISVEGFVVGHLQLLLTLECEKELCRVLPFIFYIFCLRFHEESEHGPYVGS
jgi:hypothetical protein